MKAKNNSRFNRMLLNFVDIYLSSDLFEYTYTHLHTITHLSLSLYISPTPYESYGNLGSSQSFWCILKKRFFFFEKFRWNHSIGKRKQNVKIQNKNQNFAKGNENRKKMTCIPRALHFDLTYCSEFDLAIFSLQQQKCKCEFVLSAIIGLSNQFGFISNSKQKHMQFCSALPCSYTFQIKMPIEMNQFWIYIHISISITIYAYNFWSAKP